MIKLILVLILFFVSDCFACRFLIFLTDKSIYTKAGRVFDVREDGAKLGLLENPQAEVPIGVVDVPGMSKDEGMKYKDTLYEIVVNTNTILYAPKYLLDYKTYIPNAESDLQSKGKITVNKTDVSSIMVDISTGKLEKDTVIIEGK